MAATRSTKKKTPHRTSPGRAAAEVRHRRHLHRVPPGDRPGLPGAAARRAQGAGPAGLREQADVRVQGRPALGLHVRRLRTPADRAGRGRGPDRRGHGGDGPPAVPAARAADRDDDAPARAGREARRAAGGAVGLGVAHLRPVRLRAGDHPRGPEGHQPAALVPPRRRVDRVGRRGDPRGVPGGRARAARVDATRASRDDGPRRGRVGVRHLRPGVRPPRRLRDPLRPALRRRRRRGRVRDLPLQGELGRGARRARSGSRSSGPRTPGRTPGCGATCSTSTWRAPSPCWSAALDEPLRHLVSDARAVGTSVTDNLYVRVVDVEAALARAEVRRRRRPGHRGRRPRSCRRTTAATGSSPTAIPRDRAPR